MTTPRYNDPSLTQDPEHFFLEVMHADDLPMHHRVEAADLLMKYYPEKYATTAFREHDPWPGQPRVTILIGGIDPHEVRISTDHHAEPTPGSLQ